MVSVMFKTVHLFFALLTLPQVLAASGAATLDLHSRATDDDKNEMLRLQNRLRPDPIPPLTWSVNREVFAKFQAGACQRGAVAGVEGTSTDGLSLLTEGAHF